MFFDIILLNPQHKARFWFAWVAATRGIKDLNKKKIREVNISRLCNEIMKFLQSESRDPSKRFSLRMSAILVNGAVKLYHEQVLLVHSETVNFIMKVHHTTIIIPRLPDSDSDFPTPPTPRTKKPKPKSKKEKQPQQETPDSLNALVLADQGPVEFLEASKARADEITLHEDLQPKIVDVATLPDDFGESIFGQPSIPLIEQPQPPKSPPSPAIRPQEIVVAAQIHAEAGDYLPLPLPILQVEITALDIAVQPEESHPAIPAITELGEVSKLVEVDASKAVQPETAMPEETEIARLDRIAAEALRSTTEQEKTVEEQGEIQKVVEELTETIIGSVVYKAKKGDKEQPEKKGRKKRDSKKKEEIAKRSAAINFLSASRGTEKINYSSLKEKINHIKGQQRDRFPDFVEFFNPVQISLEEFWPDNLIDREVFRNGQSPRRESMVVPPVRGSVSLPSTANLTGDRPHTSQLSDLSTPLMQSSPALVEHGISSTPLKRTAPELVSDPKKRKILDEQSQQLEVSHPQEIQIDQSQIDQPQFDQSQFDQLQIEQSQIDQPHIDQSQIDQPQVDRSQADQAVGISSRVEEIQQPTQENGKGKRIQEKTLVKEKAQRHRKILNIIQAWDFDMKDLTIDDIARGFGVKQTKTVMARFFSDLLSN